MVKSISPHEAEALIAAGGADVVDVREPHEFAAGHLPGARNVPLGEVKAQPERLPQGKALLFVCAGGARSETAARVAREHGRAEVYHVVGGTRAWTAAGLPVDRPPETAAAERPRREPEPAPSDAIGDPPEPGLDVVVGANLRELRAQRGYTLDELARRTGLSRALLGQIELGKVAPSVGVVWRIAQTFDVQFSALLATHARPGTRVLRGGEAKRLVSPDGRFTSRALWPFEETPDAEFYELFLAPHSREDAQPHRPGTRENLIVTSGRLELSVGNDRYELGKGDAVVFTADVPHVYLNPGSEACWMYLVMTYARGAAT